MWPKCPGHSCTPNPHVVHNTLNSVGPNDLSYRPLQGINCWNGWGSEGKCEVFVQKVFEVGSL